MPKITCYVISCSSETETKVKDFYVWGEWGSASWLPTTNKEAKRRIKKCKGLNKCQICDAQIHKIKIERKKENIPEKREKKAYKKQFSVGKLKATCHYCGKSFPVFPSQKDKRKYCSPECFWKGRKTNKEEKAK